MGLIVKPNEIVVAPFPGIPLCFIRFRVCLGPKSQYRLLVGRSSGFCFWPHTFAIGLTIWVYSALEDLGLGLGFRAFSARRALPGPKSRRISWRWRSLLCPLQSKSAL